MSFRFVFCWPLFAQPFGVGQLDWDRHLFYYAQVIKNTLRGTHVSH